MLEVGRCLGGKSWGFIREFKMVFQRERGGIWKLVYLGYNCIG